MNLQKLSQKSFLKLSGRILACSLIFGTIVENSRAELGFTNLTQTDFDKISKELSSNFTHNSVLGASSLGKIFGLELAVVGGYTLSPEIDTIVKRSAPGSDLPKLYNAGFIAAVSVPFGITAEAVLTPKVTAADASYQATSLAVKLSMNDELIPIIPFNLALRGIYSTNEFSFKQTISAVEATVKDANNITGLQILLSPKLPIVEPYAGIGFLNAKNTLSVSGTTGTIFDSSFNTTQSADSTLSSTQLLLGVDVRFLMLTAGVEYSKAFDASKYTAKFGFSF